MSSPPTYWNTSKGHGGQLFRLLSPECSGGLPWGTKHSTEIELAYGFSAQEWGCLGENQYGCCLTPWKVIPKVHGSEGKESACKAGDLGSIPGWGRSPGEGNGYPLQYSCLGNSMDRGTWWATIHGITRVGHDWVINIQSAARTSNGHILESLQGM